MLLLLSFTAFLLAGAALETLAARRRNHRTWNQPAVLAVRLLVLSAIYGFWFALACRPVTAAILALATVAVFVGASRAKESLLDEPLVFLDLQFVGQILRHPRLYYAQLLLEPRGALAVGGVLIALAGLLLVLLRTEQPPAPQPTPVARLLLLVAPLLLWAIPRHRDMAPKLQAFLHQQAGELRPRISTARWGLFGPMLAHYSRWIAEEESNLGVDRPLPRPQGDPSLRPHVLAVQCESFIDPRRLFRDAPCLPAFEKFKIGAAAHGPLQVPCGGAYTMRTEFSFLTGLPPESLGCDRFNPYARADRRDYPSLAKSLRRAGYATDFVHPHDLRFFRRDAVMPALGFERLHGAERFASAPRCGPHVADTALADYLAALLAASHGPRFVFAVTMENHGPWHRGRLAGCGSAREAYLRHLSNSDRMLGILGKLAASLDRPLVLCWYGDHAPILAHDLSHTKAPRTDYLILTNHLSRSSAPYPATLSADRLPSLLLSLAGNEAAPEDSRCVLKQSATIAH